MEFHVWMTSNCALLKKLTNALAMKNSWSLLYCRSAAGNLLRSKLAKEGFALLNSFQARCEARIAPLSAMFSGNVNNGFCRRCSVWKGRVMFFKNILALNPNPLFVCIFTRIQLLSSTNSNLSIKFPQNHLIICILPHKTPHLVRHFLQCPNIHLAIVPAFPRFIKMPSAAVKAMRHFMAHECSHGAKVHWKWERRIEPGGMDDASIDC